MYYTAPNSPFQFRMRSIQYRHSYLNYHILLAIESHANHVPIKIIMSNSAPISLLTATNTSLLVLPARPEL